MFTFQALETSYLIGLRANQTAAYEKLLKVGSNEELETCRVWISLIRKEINSRQEKDPNTSKSDANIKFEEKDESNTSLI